MRYGMDQPCIAHARQDRVWLSSLLRRFRGIEPAFGTVYHRFRWNCLPIRVCGSIILGLGRWETTIMAVIGTLSLCMRVRFLDSGRSCMSQMTLLPFGKGREL